MYSRRHDTAEMQKPKHVERDATEPGGECLEMGKAGLKPAFSIFIRKPAVIQAAFCCSGATPWAGRIPLRDAGMTSANLTDWS
jgi:hypothetical protein